jgi:hypothetical protein
LRIDYSNRFKREMPHLLNVPGFDGIRIHTGNTAKDTSGCILVGRIRKPDRIEESKLAYESLMNKLQFAIHSGEHVVLNIVR